MSDILKGVSLFIFFLSSAAFVGAWVAVGFYVAQFILGMLL